MQGDEPPGQPVQLVAVPPQRQLLPDLALFLEEDAEPRLFSAIQIAKPARAECCGDESYGRGPLGRRLSVGRRQVAAVVL